MRTLKPSAVILLVQGALLAGCVPMTPNNDAQFGDAVRLGAWRQTIDPNAGNTVRGIPGLDGAAAKGTMDRYNKSFVQPEPQPDALSIGVGGSGASGYSR